MGAVYIYLCSKVVSIPQWKKYLQLKEALQGIVTRLHKHRLEHMKNSMKYILEYFASLNHRTRVFFSSRRTLFKRYFVTFLGAML